MGLSHLSIIGAHPEVRLAAMCDSSKYMLDVLNKYTGVPAYTQFEKMLDSEQLDAVIIATPSKAHAGMVKTALEKNVHVFCEKPFCLNWKDAEQLAETAKSRQLVNQVGYHYRFVGAFQEVKRLLDLGAIGKVSHAQAEAYGPVILRPKGMSWRTQKDEGGGCLYDYAAHPVNLLNWYFGDVQNVGGTMLNRLFSADTDDEVLSTMRFQSGASAQLSVNWSDESYRKMSVKMTIWGTAGRIYADRQECQVYLRDTVAMPQGYRKGWNARYTTDLTEPVWFYMRGEEYSAQLDYFVRHVAEKRFDNISDFSTAAVTDKALAMMVADARTGAIGAAVA
jgi:predicted dehydrogenase